MAIIRGGIFGNASGSVGNVTFARARGGLHIARARSSPSNPRTEAQQRQRARFKQLQAFGAAFRAAGLVQAFWRPYATGSLSSDNVFLRAQSRTMPEGLDPLVARISLGNGLEAVSLTSVAPIDPTRYELLVESPIEGADGADLLVTALYNGLRNQVLMNDTGITRASGVVEMVVPSVWSQQEEDALFAYAFAYRVGATRRLRLSESAVRKVNANAFEVPAAEVPPAETVQEVPFGQQVG